MLFVVSATVVLLALAPPALAQDDEFGYDETLAKLSAAWKLSQIRDDADMAAHRENEDVCVFSCPDGSEPKPRPGGSSDPIDGCARSMLQVKPLFDPATCCAARDSCYNTCEPHGKIECDVSFRHCLEEECERDFTDEEAPVRDNCHSNVSLFYLGVVGSGCDVFSDAQRNACVC